MRLKMRKCFLFFICFVLLAKVHAQSVGVGTTTPTSTLDVNGSFSIRTITITGNTTLDSSHALVLCNSTSVITITLPTAIGITGRIYQVKRINTGGVNIVPTAGQLIDGTSTISLDVKYATIQVVSDGTNWMLITQPVHYIGESYGGGKVFYVYDGGQHGLIAPIGDNSAGISWATITYQTTFFNAVRDGIRSGYSNTERIATQAGSGSYAAQLCANSIVGNYGDWYLPSKTELSLLYSQKSIIGGFSDALYWTSSESGSTGATVVNFVDGFRQIATKETLCRVRAIRAF